LRPLEEAFVVDEPVQQLTGGVVQDPNGEKIGTVTDVIFDDIEMRPRWAVVTYGMFNQHHRVVPTSEVYRSDAGTVVAALDKATVHHAPSIGAHGVLTPELEREARRYYGLAA
jgi:uncharacterized protein YrrD